MIYIILIDLSFLIQEGDPERKIKHSSSMHKVEGTLQGKRESDKKKKKCRQPIMGELLSKTYKVHASKLFWDKEAGIITFISTNHSLVKGCLQRNFKSQPIPNRYVHKQSIFWKLKGDNNHDVNIDYRKSG